MKPLSILLISIILFACSKADINKNYIILDAPATGVYHAAYPDFTDSEDSVNAPAIAKFESLANKNIAWVFFSNNWWHGIKFPKNEVDIILKANRLPFIRLMCRSNESGNAPDNIYSQQNIIDGKFDADLMQWFKNAAKLNTPLLCEYGTEVNGEWFPWNGRWNGAGETNQFGSAIEADGPERFKTAYQHIIELSRIAGATNITWFYHVNHEDSPEIDWNSMQSYYPGDDYIDWLGVSIYGPLEPNDQQEWRSFSHLLNNVYSKLCSISPDKPIAIEEYGVLEDDKKGDKAMWISDVFNCLKTNKFPNIKAISYWNESWENTDGTYSHLEINSSEASLNAYRTGVADSFFISKPLFKIIER